MLTGLFVCAGQKDKNDILETIISCYVDRTMEELQREKQGEYLQWEPDFFAAGMRAFTFYRILIDKIYEMAGNKTFGDICEEERQMDICSKMRRRLGNE